MARKKTKTLATENKLTSIKIEGTEYNFSIPNGNDLSVNSIQADTIDCASIDVDDLVVNSHLAVGGIKSTASDQIYVSNGETGAWKTLTVTTTPTYEREIFNTRSGTMTLEDGEAFDTDTRSEYKDYFYFSTNQPLEERAFYLVYGNGIYDDNTAATTNNSYYACYGLFYCVSTSNSSSLGYFRGHVGKHIKWSWSSDLDSFTTNTLNFVKLWSMDEVEGFDWDLDVILTPYQTISYA